MNKERIRKRFRLNPALLIIVFLAVLCAAYITVRVLGTLSQKIESVTVTKMTAYESISGSGWLVRDEAIVRSTNSENVKHLVSSGEKVGNGTVLAEVYSNTSAMNYAKQLDALDDDIALLQSAMQSAGNYSDAAKVDQMISNQLKSISVLVESGICTQLADASYTLRQLSLRRNATTLDTAEMQMEIDSLISQRDTLASRVERQSSQIQAGASGYFSEVVDGYETVLSYDKIADLNASQFEALVEEEPAQHKNAFGKIVKGFSWYFAMPITAEEASELRVGRTVTLRFSQVSQDLDAKVVLINSDPSGERALLVLKSNSITNEILVGRKMNAEVILTSHTGLKVPTDAVHLVEDSEGNKQLGVYILTGSTSRFKQITPIYQGENYYLVAQENSDKALVAGDNVIVYGLNLADGKALK